MSEEAPSQPKFPWAAVASIFVLAAIGIALLAFMVYSLANPAPLAPEASPTAAATALAAVPTTTAPPPTPESTATTEPTLAPTEAPTAESTPTPELLLNIAQPANVRSGPGLTYSVIGGINSGQSVVLMGRDASATWFAVPYEGGPNGMGWISNLVATYSGDVNSLPVFEAAAPPPAASPTSAAPANTAPTNTAPPPATNTPAVLSSRGIVATFFKVENTTAGAGQDIWFQFEVVNTSNADVAYSALAAHTDVGYTAQSWTNETLRAGQQLTWRDHINIDKAGTYQLYLGICYGGREACLSSSAPWDRLSNYVTVVVQ